MKNQYCIRKGCTHRLCPHHYSNGKRLLQSKVLRRIELKDFEMFMGCKSRKIYEFFKEEFSKKKRP